MTIKDKVSFDCSRGCKIITTPDGEKTVKYDYRSCKLSVFNWLKTVYQEELKDYFEVRFKNTRKYVYKNTTGQRFKDGDIVVVEAQNGCDVGIITLSGAIVAQQLRRDKIDIKSYEFKQLYRKAKPTDIEKWQESIAKEHRVMIRARQIAADLHLNMKIGDVEFQGDGTKAIFYYIADERVDFRQLIKLFAEEFKIRIEMKQIGARQEAGLIGGLGVCGQALCCARYMNDFQSITTQAARCQDLSLNPQKLAGQCGKLKCCINYEAPVYIEAHSKLPRILEPLQLTDGEAFLVKTDILAGKMWFSYDRTTLSNVFSLSINEVKEIIFLNKKGEKGNSLMDNVPEEKDPEFKSAVGEESISRFDSRKKNRRPNNKQNKKVI
jgi:cell fate regulator YaaT (PSP1 superfamily)